ncbi:hypothetical protein AVEN_163259-1, partial [Araneus ventricosus]
MTKRFLPSRIGSLTKVRMEKMEQVNRLMKRARIQIGNPPLRRSKSAAAVDSLRKCHNGYRVAEGTFGTSLVHESKSFVTIQRPFRLEYQNCHSP